MHGVPAIPVKCILQKVGEEVVKQFRLPRVANTFRSRAHNKDEKTIETRTLCRMRHSEVVQSLLKRTWNLLPRKLGTYPTVLESQRNLCPGVCENSSDHRTEQVRRKLSHLGQIVTMIVESSLWTAAHLFTW